MNKKHKLLHRDNEYITSKLEIIYEEDIQRIVEEKNNLQSKIDKAIEYINTWLVDEYSICVPDKECPDIACVYEPKAIDKLLDILKEDK